MRETNNDSEKKYMKKAIEKCKKGVDKGESPFGACIVKDNKILSLEYNTVLSSNNAINHAEMNAIKKASQRTNDWDLSGSVIYSTTEPCPMCFSAIHWARIDRVVFGTRIEDVKKLGFSELPISNEEIAELEEVDIKIASDFMRKECLELLEYWEEREGRIY